MGRYLQDFLEGEEAAALEAVKLAVELCADVNAANDRGQTALHATASMGADTIVQLLVDQGTKVNTADKIGQTPWSLAAAISLRLESQGELRLHQSTANLLLKLGAATMTAEDFDPRNRVKAGSYVAKDMAGFILRNTKVAAVRIEKIA